MIGAWPGRGSGLTCKVRAGATEGSRGTGLYPEIRGEGCGGEFSRNSGSAGRGVGRRHVKVTALDFIRRAMGGRGDGEKHGCLWSGTWRQALALQGCREGDTSFISAEPQHMSKAVPSDRLQFQPRKNFLVCRAPRLGSHMSWCDQDSGGQAQSLGPGLPTTAG